ncbi:MAG: HEAT repeat domain-containing protein [Planctomycetota bacterium]
MKPVRTNCLLAAVLLVLAACSGAAASEAEELIDRVKKADLVVLGQVIRITEGEQDPESLRVGVKFRTDIAALVVIEVLKGDPDLKKVEIGFPGFPKAGDLTPKANQNGVWLLTKSDQKFYEAKTAAAFMPADKLGAARRAVRAAIGLVEPPEKPADRVERIARLCADLAGDKPDATRQVAAYQLGEMGELNTVPKLIDALDDAAPSVRLAADIALRKVTGHRTQVDFQNETAALRARGADEWRKWWEANKDKKRQDVLLAAAKASRRPQPEFRHAVEGLAQYDDPAFLPVFRTALDSAISRENNSLVIAAARYLGGIKDRESVPKLAGILDETWPTPAARAAAATAVGKIIGKNFGTGADAVRPCAEWWAANKTTGAK